MYRVPEAAHRSRPSRGAGSLAPLASLETIRTYIADFSPLAAQRMALRLMTAGQSLADHPERGRAIGGGRRELVTVPPYLIRYRVRADAVEILAIRHGARSPV